jgi:hypothetical protein
VGGQAAPSALARLIREIGFLNAGSPGLGHRANGISAALGATLHLAPLGASKGYWTETAVSSAHHGWTTPQDVLAPLRRHWRHLRTRPLLPRATRPQSAREGEAALRGGR